MSKNSSKPLRVAPLQELTLVPITDPVELAARERMYHESKKRAAAKKPTPAQVRQQYRQLSAASRRKLLARLAAELSADEQRELMDLLLAQLPAEAVRQPREPLRNRNGGR